MAMSFLSSSSPVYGGGELKVKFDIQQEALNDPSVGFFLVFEGELQRHITRLRHTESGLFTSVIPAHHQEETVQLSALCYQFNNSEIEYGILYASSFRYMYDSAYYLAQFLVESVYNVNALDDLELIRSDHFDLSNENLATLDDRLYGALKYLDIPDWWSLLGPNSPLEYPHQQPRETLLHFVARLGLEKVALILLDRPGGELALRVHNLDGKLPKELAAENGFIHLSQVLTEYNRHFVKVDEKPLVVDVGLISYYPNRELSLSTYLQQPIEKELQLLLRICTGLDSCPNHVFGSDCQADWPAAVMEQEHEIPFGQKSEEKLKEIIKKSKDLQIVIESLGSNLGSTEHLVDLDSYDHSNEDLSKGPQGIGGHLQCGEFVEEEDILDSAYDGSLAELHQLNQGLLKQRDYNRNLLVAQDARKNDLSRFSSSCPSLEAQSKQLEPPEDTDEDHHHSMLDLNKNEAQYQSSTSMAPGSSWADDEQSFRYSSEHQDSNVQIYVNGETVEDTEEEFKLDASLNKFVHEFYGGNTPGSLRRRSWCPSLLESERLRQYQNQAEGEILRGSLSLNTSDVDEETTEDDDEEETYHDAKEEQTPQRHGRLVPRLDNSDLPPLPMEAISVSPSGSPCNSPLSRAMPNAGLYDQIQQGSAGDTLVQTLYGLKQELITPRDKKNLGVQNEISPKHAETPHDSTVLAVPPHSNITKSLSTPSIPASVTTGERKSAKDPKQEEEPTYLLIQKLIQEHDAQFRRQDEIEEDDDESTNRLLGQEKSRRRSEISLLDFLNDPNALEEAKNAKKDEKKRKTSVFSRLQNSYRTKKHKEKDQKGKTTHQFVPVSVSNTTLPCFVCRKSLANKPALQCQSCLVTVHENSCKEQITPCEKIRSNKGPQMSKENPVQMTNSLRQKQTSLPTQVSGLRQTQSFKRSSSGPAARSQTTLQHRRSLPTASLSVNPAQQSRTGSIQYSPWKRARDLLIGGDNKPINEESEGDFYKGQDIATPASILDANSGSQESLDEVDSQTQVSQEFDQELQKLLLEQGETWSGSMEKKVIKKMNTKDVKRQDTIWEFIQTERHHCRTLKILDQIHRQSMKTSMRMTDVGLNLLFPRLDDLINIHMTFLRKLQDLQTKKPDHSVDEIGDTLVKQFSGESAERMKSAYGGFCSGQKKSVGYYKDLLAKDRKFHNLMRMCNNHELCKKREIPDFLLLITQRPSKYLTLIEAILKSTKDKKDREHLSQALALSRELLESINEQVAVAEKKDRLIEIYQKFDSRSTSLFKDKKFKKSDIHKRNLLHEGVIGLKNARGKATEVMAVVLTDLVFFMQESNGRYGFFAQDNKPSIVPLYQLVVREKGDTRADSNGIYLITQKNPEMYEIVCNSSQDRHKWISVLRAAVDKCPADEEETEPEVVLTDESEEERKYQEKISKVKDILDQLKLKDEDIKRCCDDKNSLMEELVELCKLDEAQPSRMQRPGSHAEDSNIDPLQAAIQEVTMTADRLTSMLQSNTSSQLCRHVSSVGEHMSAGFFAPPIPKRAETFAGFDHSYDSGKVFPKKRPATTVVDIDINSPSTHTADSGLDLSHTGDREQPPDKPLEADDSLDSSKLYEAGYSDTGSLGDISGSSSHSAVLIPGDHTTSIAHLARSLHNIVHLTAKQGTALECLKAELADANERITKLSAEVHEPSKKGVQKYSHNQLEELRNQQLKFNKEKQEKERELERQNMMLEHERTLLEEQSQSLKQKEAELEAKHKEMLQDIQNQKNELKRQREWNQQQIDMWMSKMGEKEGHLPKNMSAPVSHFSMEHQSAMDAAAVHPREPSPSDSSSHRRSASADFCQMIEEDLDRIKSGNYKSKRDLPARTESRAGSANFSSSANKKGLPEHLLSAKNEQKVVGTLSNRGMNSSGSSSSLPGAGTKGGVQQVLPFKLSSSGGSNSSLSGLGTSGPGPSSTSSGIQKHPLSNKGSQKQTSNSSLSLLMKLAEPHNSKGRSSSLTSSSNLLGDKGGAGPKSASMDVPASAGSGEKGSSTDKNSEIYC